MKPIDALPLALVLFSCQAAGPEHRSAWSGELEQWGTLRAALRDGQVEARVRVADVAREGVWAVGALEGLRGEITIADGEVWISEGGAERAVTTRGRDSEASATVLFAAEVAEWHELTLEADVDPSVLDAFLAEQAAAVGIDVSAPFPFVVDGGLEHVRLHVIGGECPIRARMLGRAATFPPYELDLAAAPGRLVGIYAPDSGGVVCHAGSRSHAHALLEADGGLTGHVETVGLRSGSILRLPRR